MHLEQPSAYNYSIKPSTNFVEFSKEDIEQSISNRFEQQVTKYPQSIAIKSKSETLTYEQLNRNANRIARVILAQRGNREVIALLIEQGAGFITNMFAVLKTGKIYVPLDPIFPRDRLTYILEDSQAGLIITNSQNLALAYELAGDVCSVVNIDDLDESISTDNLEVVVPPDAPAYLIYTSGSTGKPKGVLQSHRNVLYYSMVNTNAMYISPDDRMTLLYSCSVMGAVRCIFNSLLNGASLHPLNIKEDGLLNLSNWLIEEEITIYHSVATVFRHFVGTLKKIRFPKIRVIRLGGEPVMRTDVELYKKYFSNNCVMYASLGSTETGTVRHFIVDKKTQINTSTVPIGYAVEDMEILLLDEAGNQVDSGCVGEIAVKSKYLALGYWRKTELTKAAFSYDQKEGLDSEKRIYRTGDLGRFEPDGCLVHMGRRDFQVKIRGFRIELSEIEVALLSTDVVKEAVVIAIEDRRGEKCLVAYVVAKEGKTLIKQELRRYLQQKLPDYMLPTAFVFLDALPLTPNSKIDRLALPAPQVEAFIAPSNDLERIIAQIWEEVLGIRPIGVKDNFFELGGNSLQAIHLFAQIENRVGKKLPLATLLESGTVEALARIINWEKAHPVSEQNKVMYSWSSLVKIRANGSKPPLFCIHPLGGEILCYRDLALLLGSDQPVYGLQPQGLDGKPAYTTVEDMALHYIKEIQIVQPNGPYYLVGYSFGGVLAYEMAQQLYQQGQKIGMIVMLDTCRPGYCKRIPFAKRILLNLNNLSQEGLAYIKQNVQGWSQWSKYMLKEKYKHYLNTARYLLNVIYNLPKDDNHLNVIDTNAKALENYTFPPYPGSVTLLRTDDRSRENAVGVKYDPQFGWGDIVLGELDIHYIPGSHESFLQQPNVQVVAEKLNFCLTKAYIVQTVCNTEVLFSKNYLAEMKDYSNR